MLKLCHVWLFFSLLHLYSLIYVVYLCLTFFYFINSCTDEREKKLVARKPSFLFISNNLLFYVCRCFIKADEYQQKKDKQDKPDRIRLNVQEENAKFEHGQFI